jgi:hypothetical protein
LGPYQCWSISRTWFFGFGGYSKVDSLLLVEKRSKVLTPFLHPKKTRKLASYFQLPNWKEDFLAYTQVSNYVNTYL